jgi:hypothetical protein
MIFELSLNYVIKVVLDYTFLFVFGATAPPPPPQWTRASPFTRFLDHTLRRTTFGRTSLDEWSARRRNLYLTSHEHSQQTNIHAPRWDSSPQSQQASGSRPTPLGRQNMVWIIDSKKRKPHLQKLYCREVTITVIRTAGRYCCNQLSTAELRRYLILKFQCTRTKSSGHNVTV